MGEFAASMMPKSAIILKGLFGELGIQPPRGKSLYFPAEEHQAGLDSLWFSEKRDNRP